MAIDLEKIKKRASLFKQPVDIDKVLKDLQLYINDMQEDNAKLQGIIKEFNKDDELAKKDAEIEELKSELRDMIGYLLNSEEDEEMKAAMKAHTDSTHPGARWDCSYIVTPTGLGSVLEVRCNHCGDIIYQTDNIG